MVSSPLRSSVLVVLLFMSVPAVSADTKKGLVREHIPAASAEISAAGTIVASLASTHSDSAQRDLSLEVTSSGGIVTSSANEDACSVANGEWVLGGPSESCSTACANVGKKCTPACLSARNGDVDTDGELLDVLGTFGVDCGGGFVRGNERAKAVPLFVSKNGKCVTTESNRPKRTFGCDRVPTPARAEKRRLCWCQMRATTTTTTEEMITSSEECATPHDFIVGIDASNSIGEGNWPLQVDFANSVIAELLGMDAGHRVATYYFAGVATKVSDFSDDVAALQSHLSALAYKDVKFGATNHPAGFILSEELFGGSPLADSKKLHLLVTDGQPWKSCQHLTDEQVRALPCTPACKNKRGTCDYLSAKGRPIGAYCKCAIHTADAFNSKYATYTVGVLNKNNRTADGKLMAMSTSPEFYMPATIESLPSLIKNVTLGMCKDPATTTSTTTTTTEASACNAVGPDQHLRLDRASVTHSNLGGRGPDPSGPEHIRYADVATLADGTVVDLVVSSRGVYTPFEGQVVGNGISVHGPIGIIGMEASEGGNAVDLDFSFVSSSSGLPVELAALDFSILDADMGLTSAQESVTVSGFDSFYISQGTEVKVSTAPDGRATFTATQSGHHHDNPRDPLHLTEQQAKRSVNFVFTTVSKISMTLAVSNSAWVYGRDFLFSGKSAVKDCGVKGEWAAPAAQ